MNSHFKRILAAAGIAVIAASMLSCNGLTNESKAAETAQVTFQIVAEEPVSTRSTFRWSESEIRDIQIVITEDDGSVCDVLYSGSTSGLSFTGAVGRRYRIWAAANLGGKVEVHNLQDFTSGTRRVTAAGIAASGIPMFNGTDGQEITLPETSGQVTIMLTRMLARVDLNVDTRLLESASLFNVRTVNIYNAINTYSPFTPAASQEHSGSIDYFFDSASEKDIVCINGGGTISLYAFENMQGTLLSGNTDPWKKVPGSIGNAGAYCTYLEVGCTYGSSGNEVTYRMYLGKDTVTNFDVERNTIYNVTLMPSENEIRGGRGSWKVEAEPWNDVVDVRLVLEPSTLELELGDDYSSISSYFLLTYENGDKELDNALSYWIAGKNDLRVIDAAIWTPLNTDSRMYSVEVRAIASGSASVTATAYYDGVEYTAACEITVRHEPVYSEESEFELSIEPESIILSEGQDASLTATLTEHVYLTVDGVRISDTPVSTNTSDVTGYASWLVKDGAGFVSNEGGGVFSWASGPGTATVSAVYNGYRATSEIITNGHTPIITYSYRIEIEDIGSLEVGQSENLVVRRYTDTYSDGILVERDDVGETIPNSLVFFAFGSSPDNMAYSDPYASLGGGGTITGLQPGTCTVLAVLREDESVYSTLDVEIIKPDEPDPEPVLTISVTELDTWGGNGYPVTLLYDDGRGNVSDVTADAFYSFSFTGGIPNGLLGWNGSELVAEDWWGMFGSWVTAGPTYTLTLSYNGLSVEISGTMHGYTHAEVVPEKPVWYYSEIEDHGWSGPAAVATLFGSETTEVWTCDTQVINRSRYTLGNGYLGLGSGIPFHAYFTDPSNGYTREGDSSFAIETNVMTLQVSIYPEFAQYAEVVGLVESTVSSGEFLGSAGIRNIEEGIPSFIININQDIWYEDYKGDTHQLTFPNGSAPSNEVISLSGGWSLKSDWTDTIYEGELRTVEINVNGFSASWQWGHIGSH